MFQVAFVQGQISEEQKRFCLAIFGFDGLKLGQGGLRLLDGLVPVSGMLRQAA